jgi:RimJ/RimL family protein N-acetyltransferase
MAEQWIATHQPKYAAGESASFAITLKPSGELIGAVGLTIQTQHERAELGYWVGKTWWGQGYCTEAARAVLEFGFAALGLNRILAYHLSRNPTSGRVMQKLGMRHEGQLRQHVKKWDTFEDVDLYGVLKSDWAKARNEPHGNPVDLFSKMSENAIYTIPFAPCIVTCEGFADDDMLPLDTGLVIVRPPERFTPNDFDGADKVVFRVAKAGNLTTTYEILGEFICGKGDYSEVCISIFPNNEVSPQLAGMTVRIPLSFISEIRSRFVC